MSFWRKTARHSSRKKKSTLVASVRHKASRKRTLIGSWLLPAPLWTKTHSRSQSTTTDRLTPRRMIIFLDWTSHPTTPRPTIRCRWKWESLLGTALVDTVIPRDDPHRKEAIQTHHWSSLTSCTRSGRLQSIINRNSSSKAWLRTRCTIRKCSFWSNHWQVWRLAVSRRQVAARLTLTSSMGGLCDQPLRTGIQPPYPC